MRFFWYNSDMKIPGIIGGLGPETTANFYLQLNQLAIKNNFSIRPACLIWNTPIPYSIEQQLLLNNTGIEKYEPYLVDAAKHLESGGADFIVIPCNTVHLLIEKVRQATTLPVISIVDETALALQLNGVKKVLVLATEQTVSSNLYSKQLKSMGVEEINITQAQQTEINEMILRLVHSQQTDADKQKLVEIMQSYETNTDATVFACSDLHSLVSSSEKARVYDSMQILAEATIREIQKDSI